MVKPLQEILETQFNLQYHLKVSVQDFENMDLKEIEWIYGRLIKEKRDENEAKKKKKKNE